MTPKACRIRIRSARPADLPDLLALLKELFRIERDFTFDPRRQRRGLRLMLGRSSRRRVWVAVRAGKVVGLCTAQVVISTAMGGPAAVLEDVVVCPAHRREGIGRFLIEAAMAWAWRRGIARLHLLADQANRPALSFYRTLGWKKTRLICLHRHLEAARTPRRSSRPSVSRRRNRSGS